MPGSRTRSVPSPDDSLMRLIILPEREQEKVLAAFVNALEEAEARVIRREAILYDAKHPPVQPAQPRL